MRNLFIHTAGYNRHWPVEYNEFTSCIVAKCDCFGAFVWRCCPSVRFITLPSSGYSRTYAKQGLMDFRVSATQRVATHAAQSLYRRASIHQDTKIAYIEMVAIVDFVNFVGVCPR